MNVLVKFIFFSCLILLSFQSCYKDIDTIEIVNKSVTANNYDASIVVDWNNLLVEIDRYSPDLRPCPIARAIGYINLASYEAIAPGMIKYKSVSHNLNITVPVIFPDQEYHWPTVYNAAQAYMFKRFFATTNQIYIQRINTLENRSNIKYSAIIDAEVFQRSQIYGQSVANAIWEWSKTDEITHDSHLNIFGDYNWLNTFKKNGDWKPTSAGGQNGLFAFFGRGRTFVINQDLLLCKPPLPFNENPNSPMHAQALEVYAYNTPIMEFKNKWISEFWSDDLANLTFSPASRWLAIASQVYVNEKSSLETAVLSNAKIGLTLNDAAIGTWNSKYFYNIERPETYIRRVIDPNWSTNLSNPLTNESGITPPHPSFPSEHASFGAAAAEALSSVFGYNYEMTDRCHENRTEFISTPRYFRSFFDMAEENGNSRAFLGVHFKMDAIEGVKYGKEIGRRVNRLGWEK